MTEKYRITNKGRIAPNGYRLCDPLSEGTILQDNHKKVWVIGKTIGCGGFGEIYLCHDKNDASKTCVMKLDNINGPLFVEVNFAIRACKATIIKAFLNDRKMSFLGIPDFIAAGTATVGEAKYRFLVMERLGEELQKVLERTRLSVGVVCRIASRIIDGLEYIHEQGYIHADIKAQNILRSAVTSDRSKKGKRANEETDDDVKNDDKYYLIDFGLVERYTFQGAHKPNELDKRTANNGTCEFRSRDAHIGVISRRSDIESLGFNLILWFYGRHPWADLLKNPDKVHQKKIWAMNHINEFLKEAFSGDVGESSDGKPTPKSKAASKKTIPTASALPKGLNKFFEEIKSLSHDEMPNYQKLRQILNEIAVLNSDDSVSATSNGNKKKASITASITKKTINKSNKRKSDSSDVDIIDSPVKTKRALTSKVPLKTKSTQVLVNGHSNGAIDLSDYDTEEDDSVYEPPTKSSSKKNSKVKSSTTKKLNGVRSKRNSLVVTAKKSTLTANLEKNGNPKSRILRKRIQVEEDLSDENESLLNGDNYSNNNRPKTPKRALPRLSTPLIMMTPPEGGESPLFGPFEADDSVKENQILPNGNIHSNNISLEDEEVETEAMRQIRVYINNKRCSEKGSDHSKNKVTSSRGKTPSHRAELSECSDSSLTSTDSIDVKPVKVNGKSGKSRISITSKAKPLKPNGNHKLNGKVKTNGHITSSTASSSSTKPATTTAARKARKGRALFSPEEHVTISPNSMKANTVDNFETPAMRRLRMKIEAKRNSATTVTKK